MFVVLRHEGFRVVVTYVIYLVSLRVHCEKTPFCEEGSFFFFLHQSVIYKGVNGSREELEGRTTTI